MDPLEVSLQRDISIDAGMRIPRDPLTDWPEFVTRRLNSRDPSFDNGLLSHRHRDMSISMEFGKPLRSHISMEMQIPTSRTGVGASANAAGEQGIGNANAGGELRPSFSSLFGPSPSVDGFPTLPPSVSDAIGGASGSAGTASCPGQSGGHISRSRHVMSKDDLMVDLGNAQSQTDKVPYKFMGTSIIDFNNVRTHFPHVLI
jgi:hypothetical protein